MGALTSLFVPSSRTTNHCRNDAKDSRARPLRLRRRFCPRPDWAGPRAPRWRHCDVHGQKVRDRPNETVRLPSTKLPTRCTRDKPSEARPDARFLPV